MNLDQQIGRAIYQASNQQQNRISNQLMILRALLTVDSGIGSGLYIDGHPYQDAGG